MQLGIGKAGAEKLIGPARIAEAEGPALTLPRNRARGAWRRLDEGIDARSQRLGNVAKRG
jgi:hypothetical protein